MTDIEAITAMAAPLCALGPVGYEVGDGWARASVDTEAVDLEVTAVLGGERHYFSTIANGQHYAGIVLAPAGVDDLVEFARSGVLNARHLDVGSLP